MLPSLTCLLPQGSGMRLLGTRLCRGMKHGKGKIPLWPVPERKDLGVPPGATLCDKTWACAKAYPVTPSSRLASDLTSGVTGRGVGGYTNSSDLQWIFYIQKTGCIFNPKNTFCHSENVTLQYKMSRIVPFTMFLRSTLNVPNLFIFGINQSQKL